MDKPAKRRVAHVEARQLLTAVSAVHSLGYLHRDVKPKNVLLGQDGLRGPETFACKNRRSTGRSSGKKTGRLRVCQRLPGPVCRHGRNLCLLVLIQFTFQLVVQAWLAASCSAAFPQLGSTEESCCKQCGSVAAQLFRFCSRAFPLLDSTRMKEPFYKYCGSVALQTFFASVPRHFHSSWMQRIISKQSGSVAQQIVLPLLTQHFH